MSETEERIIEAAIGAFVRYGPKKTTMADIAEAAEVSRQTVYALFGDKDGVIVAAIRHVTDRSLAAVRAGIEDCPSLAGRLEIYFAETTRKSFELLQSSADAEDLISGHNAAGKSEIVRSHRRHEELLSEILAPYQEPIAGHGQSCRELANFVVTVAMAIKYGATSLSELEALLTSLKISVLAVTGASEDEA